MIRVGVSACFFHPDPERATFKGKTLLYAEQSMTHLFQSRGAIAYILPSSPNADYASIAHDLDGLVLEGGADVCPKSYGETPLDPKWNGDLIRDEYEIALTRAFVAAEKPVLGICRGLQLMNVAFGGTLYQDINTQVPGSLTHRNWEIYDQNFHAITFAPGSRLEKWYHQPTRTTNSVHHQGIKKLAPGFVAEAHASDGIIEAICSTQHDFVYGVQWHPEFHEVATVPVLPAASLVDAFLAATRK